MAIFAIVALLKIYKLYALTTVGQFNSRRLHHESTLNIQVMTRAALRRLYLLLQPGARRGPIALYGHW